MSHELGIDPTLGTGTWTHIQEERAERLAREVYEAFTIVYDFTIPWAEIGRARRDMYMFVGRRLVKSGAA